MYEPLLNGVEWWWVQGHWDIHLSGIVRYEGERLNDNGETYSPVED